MGTDNQPSGKLDELAVVHMTMQNVINTLETTNEKIEKTNDKVDKLTEIVSGQAVLFEKLTNIEVSFRQEFKHIYANLNEQHNAIAGIKETMVQGTCPAVKHLEEKRQMYVDKFNEDKQSIKDEIHSMKETIKDLKEKPGKRWDLIVTTIISSTVGAFVTFIAIKLGMKG